MTDYWKTIGQALRAARQKTEESQRNTALRLGIRPMKYCAMEDGEENPNEALVKLMEALAKNCEPKSYFSNH